MKKLLKITGIVIVLLLIALVALPIVFKGKIEEAVKSAVNDNVNATVNWSDYGLSLFSSFPDMTVSLDSLSVIGKDDFEGEVLADIPQLKLSLDVMSLFGDSAKINSFKLVNPYISVVVTEEGKANYDIAIPSDEVEPELESSSGAFSLALNSYEIENGTLSYLDNTMDMMLYLEGFNHKGAGDFTSSLIGLKTETTAEELDFVFDNITYINKVKTKIDLGLLMDMEKMRFDIEGNEIFLNDLKLVAEGFVEMPSDDILMDIKYNAPSTDIKQLISMVPSEFTGDLNGLNAKGILALDGFVKGTYNESQLPAIGLDIKIADGFIQYPDLPESINDIELDAGFSLPEGDNLDELVLNINTLNLNIAGNPFNARMLFSHPFTTQYLDAALKANLDFEKLSRAFPIEDTKLNGILNADVVLIGSVQDVVNKNLDNFTANGLIDVKNMQVDASDTYKMNIAEARFEVNPASIRMPKFTGKIGGSDISANGQIDNFLAYAFDDEMLKGTFNLESEVLDMNDFMTTDESSEEVSEGELEYYVDVPENLDFDLNASIKKLVYDDTELTDVEGLIGVQDGTALMKDVHLNFLGGSIKLDGSYSTKDRERPLLDVYYDLKNLDIKSTNDSFDMIAELAPIAKYCTGKFGSKMSYSSELGKDMFPIYETISAKGDVNTNKIELENFKPLNELASKLKIDKLSKQDIENVNVSFSVNDGKIIVDPYEVKLDGMKTEVSGSMSFDQEIDYLVKMDVPFSKLPQQGTEFATDLMSKINQLGTNFSSDQIVPVTVRITGTMTNPKLDLSNIGSGMVTDVKEEIKEQVEQLVQDKVDEVKVEASAKAKEEADKLIADAKKQADKIRAEGISLADKGKEEAYKGAQRIEDEAKKPWEKVAAKLAADKARKKADEAHVKAVKKANDQADKIINDAQEKANGLLAK